MKILLVDDHVLFREGMRYVLQQLGGGVTEIIEAGSFGDALLLAETHPELDLALLDMSMPGSEGALSIREFHLRFPHIPIVVVSGQDDMHQMGQVIQNGAMGYVCKNSTASLMIGALNLVLAGGVYLPPQLLGRASAPEDDVDALDKPIDKRSLNTNKHGLTRRQMEVLGYLRAGLSNKEIADHMQIAEGTAKIHVAAIYQTLRVNSRVGAVRAAERLGLFDQMQS